MVNVYLSGNNLSRKNVDKFSETEPDSRYYVLDVSL